MVSLSIAGVDESVILEQTFQKQALNMWFCVLFLAGQMGQLAIEERYEIITEWKRNPEASHRSIASKCGVHHNTVGTWILRHQTHGNVDDLPRSGRRCTLTPAMLAEIKKVASEKEHTAAFSSLRLAKHVHREFGVCVSPLTVSRALKKDKWDYRAASTAPMLKPIHKQKRLFWAQQHLKKRTCFSKWMFTDSKIFLLQKIGTRRGVKFWAPKGGRSPCPISKCSLGVHVYLGLTEYGLTKVIFVTGGQSQESDFIDPKTGKPYVGVSSPEYAQQVLPRFDAEGDLKFGINGRWSREWIFQQDGASCHTAKITKQALQERWPNRHMIDWPPNSPDLSPIENVWAWGQRQLQTSCKSINTVSELKAAISEVFKHAPKSMCRNLVRGMRGRLEAVIAKDGGYIGK